MKSLQPLSECLSQFLRPMLYIELIKEVEIMKSFIALFATVLLSLTVTAEEKKLSDLSCIVGESILDIFDLPDLKFYEKLRDSTTYNPSGLSAQGYANFLKETVYARHAFSVHSQGDEAFVVGFGEVNNLLIDTVLLSNPDRLNNLNTIEYPITTQDCKTTLSYPADGKTKLELTCEVQNNNFLMTLKFIKEDMNNMFSLQRGQVTTQVYDEGLRSPILYSKNPVSCSFMDVVIK